MDHREAIGLWNDYLDGELSSEVVSALEAHLSECAACREELAALRAVIEQAAKLPHEVTPPHKLWPAIAQRIAQAERSHERETAWQTAAPARPAAESWRQRLASGLPPWRALWPALAGTLAVLVIIVASTLNRPEPSAPDPMATAIVAALEKECCANDREVTQLMAQAADEPASPSTSALRVIADNLRLIDRAIDEARLAWESNPRSPRLMRMLVAAYEARAALQGRAAEVAAGS
jgi:hypothetical protein